MSDQQRAMPTAQKALQINLDECKYGTIVEIGAGQEVADQFFRAGGAAGTVAKTMSAYDMRFSDAIYGETSSGRYVSRERLSRMLDKEFQLLLERLAEVRPRNTTFFAYAATVSARRFGSDGECHGWIGIRLQLYPGAPPSDIVLHVRMLDKEARSQQQALGVLGVNLIYGAFHEYRQPEQIIASLEDNLAKERIEVDLIDFSGPYFEELDNRLTNLALIRKGLTRAVVFGATGEVMVPGELLYKKNVLAIRGSFRPVTRVNVDMMECSLRQFVAAPDVDPDRVVVLAEMTMAALVSGDDIDNQDFLARVDMLNTLGYSVIISDYLRYFRLRAFFRRYTDRQIGMVLGVPSLREIFREDYYEGLEGGMLEGLGKLFPDRTRLYIYPAIEGDDGEPTTLDNFTLAPHLQPLFEYLRCNQLLLGLPEADTSLLHIFSRDVLRAIAEGRDDWQQALPEAVSEFIVSHGLFGYHQD